MAINSGHFGARWLNCRICCLSRKAGERIAWAWVLLLSPLWVMLFGVFGIAPVVTRTSDLLPLVRNGMGFVGGMVGAYLIAQTIVGRKLAEETDE